MRDDRLKRIYHCFVQLLACGSLISSADVSNEMLDAFRYQPDEFDSINKPLASSGTIKDIWQVVFTLSIA